MNLSPHQFPDPGQDGLFPADHPAMRQRGPAEMSPDQYKTSPGAWFHGTYRASLPDRISNSMSGGVHFGTRKAAEDRLRDFGPRDLGNMPHEERNLVKPDAPAEIHVRRVSPDVIQPTYEHTGTDKFGRPEGIVRHPGDIMTQNSGVPRMDNTPHNPGVDLGEDWKSGDDGDRETEKSGEYYKNDAEDIGSVSLRVPTVSGYMENHRQAVSRALREGSPVHPTTKGLLDNHGGAGVDEPIKHVVEPTPITPRSAALKRNEYKPEPDHDTLLPYTLVGSGVEPRYEKVKDEPMKMGYSRTPAVTFTATPEEADKMSPNWTPSNLRDPATWRKAYRE